ncbi:MAG: hypothetical protein ACJZZ7_02645 [Cytophagales bacterium]
MDNYTSRDLLRLVGYSLREGMTTSRKICVVGSEVANPKFYKCNYGINVRFYASKK